MFFIILTLKPGILMGGIRLPGKIQKDLGFGLIEFKKVGESLFNYLCYNKSKL